MATPNRIAGTITLTIDGQSYLVDDVKYKVSKVKRETKAGQDSVHGFSEMPEPGMISFTARDWQGLSVAALTAMTGVTVAAKLANGKMIIGNNMWFVDAPEVETKESTLSVKFESKDGQVTEN